MDIQEIEKQNKEYNEQLMNNQFYMQYCQMLEMQMYMMDPCNQVQLKPNNNKNYNFNENFIRAQDYDNPKNIIENIRHLHNINQQMDISKIGNGIFFIIRSTNDDDVHKAIKYELWASSIKNNQVLSKAYQEAIQQNQNVYLFFSVVKSGQFCAVAQLVSDLQVDYSFRYWWEPNKYFGTFKIKIIFVKDVKDKLFESIKEESQDNNVVYKLRDSTRISVTNGKKMLNIFNTANTRPNIFEQFAYMDKREDIKRTQRNQDQLDTAEFNEKAAQYRQTDGNPNAFKKRPLNFNNQGLYGNPFYYRKQDLVQKEEKIETKFFIKEKEEKKQTKDHHNNQNSKQYKKNRRQKQDRQGYYQAGQNQTVEVHYNVESEEESQLEVNDNRSRPVQEQDQVQQQQQQQQAV